MVSNSESNLDIFKDVGRVCLKVVFAGTKGFDLKLFMNRWAMRGLIGEPIAAPWTCS